MTSRGGAVLPGRLAFLAAVLVPPLAWIVPVGEWYYDEPAARIGVGWALVAAALLAGVQWRGHRWSATGKAIGAAAVFAWIVLGVGALVWVTPERYFWWGPQSWWVVAMAGALLCGWAGPWPQERLLLLGGWSLAAAAILSPLLAGWGGDSGYLVTVHGLMVATAVGIALLLRRQRLFLQGQRTAVRDRERRLMADELHDVIAHELTGVVVLAQAVRPGVSDQAGEAVGRIEDAAQRALDHIRSLVVTTRDDGSETVAIPRLAALSDIDALVEEFRATTTAQVTLVSQVSADLPGPVVMAAHRLVSEALTNVRRHAASAQHVEIVLAQRGSGLEVSVRDDGVGGGLGSGGGTGLTAVAERVALVGGVVSAGPVSGGGWCVEASLPMEGWT